MSPWRLVPHLLPDASGEIAWRPEDDAISARLPARAAPDSLAARIDRARGVPPRAGMLTFGGNLSMRLDDRRLVDIEVYAPRVATAALAAVALPEAGFDAYYEGPLDENGYAGFAADIRLVHDPAAGLMLIRFNDAASLPGDLMRLAPGFYAVLGDAGLPIRAVLLTGIAG